MYLDVAERPFMQWSFRDKSSTSAYTTSSEMQKGLEKYYHLN